MADDVASLGFAVDSSQLVAASAALDKVNASAQRLVPSQTLAANASQKLNREQQLSIASSRAITLAQAELGDKVELLTRNTDAAYRSLSTRSFFRLLAREASLVGGPLGQIIQHFGILGVGGQRLGVGLTVTTIAFSAVTAAAVKTISMFIEFEKHQSQLGNALLLTRQASGQTADGLDKMARKLAESGTVTLDSVREAQAELLKFKNIGADSFERVLEASLKLSGTGFTDMKTATKALAEALKDQANATKILEAVEISILPKQQAQIDAYLRAGKILEANRLILQIVEDKTKDLKLGVDDNSSAWNRFSNAMNEAGVALGKRLSDELALKTALDATTEALKRGAAANSARNAGRVLSQDEMGNPYFAPQAATNQPARGTANRLPIGDTFDSRFDAASLTAAGTNMAALKKSMDEVTKSLDDQAQTAGMNAVELEQYNQTVMRGIPAESEAAKAIRARVAANMSATEFRVTIDALRQQEATLKITTSTVGMSTAAAAAYTAAETARQTAIIKGLPIGAEQNKRLKEQAKLIGEAAEAGERARIQSQIKFERGTMFLSDTDIHIAQQLRGLYGDDIPRALASTEAASMRVNAAMKQVADLGGTFASGLLTDLSHGVAASDALRNALTRLADSLIDMATKQLVKQALGGLLGGGLGGMLGGIGGGLGLGKAAVAHMGGVVGQTSFPTRMVPTSLFDNAPRFAMGGEVPIIAHAGERIIPAGQSGGGHTTVMNIDATGADQAAVTRLERALVAFATKTEGAITKMDRNMTSRQGQKRLLEN